MSELQHDRMSPEALIERIADGEASMTDWEAFRVAAAVEPPLWQELAEAQRLQAELCLQVQVALAAAGRVEAPVEQVMTERLTRRIRMVGAWGGWAAAAALALAWSAGMTPGMVGPGGQAALIPSTPDEALRAYLDQGQRSGVVMGELPTKVMVETRPAETGRGYEVIYVRQILERTVVPDLYRVGVDDAGQPRPVPVKIVRTGGRPM